MVKNPPASAGDVSLIPGLGSSPGEGYGNPLQYFCLENPTDRGAWRAAVHGGGCRVGHNLMTKQKQTLSRRSIPDILGKEWGFSRIGPSPTFWCLWLRRLGCFTMSVY